MSFLSSIRVLRHNYAVSSAMRSRQSLMTSGPIHQLFNMKDADVQRASLSIAKPDLPCRSVVRSTIQRSKNCPARPSVCSTARYSEGLMSAGLIGVHYQSGHHVQAGNLTGLLEYELKERLSYDTHTYFEKDIKKAREYLGLRFANFSGVFVEATEAFLWQNRFLLLGADSTKVVAPSYAVETPLPATFFIPSALKSNEGQFLVLDKKKKFTDGTAQAFVEQSVISAARDGLLDDAIGNVEESFFCASPFYSVSLWGWIMDPENFVYSLKYTRYTPKREVVSFYNFVEGKVIPLTDQIDIEALTVPAQSPVFTRGPGFYLHIIRDKDGGLILTDS
ncbi:MAG: hypothetical protein WC490_05935 [Candidatus Margulisiibacteriota bacterium]